MFRFCLLISLLALIRGGPIPNNPINTTIFNIESFFEHSLGNLAGSLISHHKANSTEHYQSADGSVQAEVEPLNLSLLQGIAFHPSNHQLITEQATTLFNNATEEVDLVKVDLALATTSSNNTLKSIPSTIVSGTTAITTEQVTTTTSSSSTTTTTTAAPTTKSVPVVIVTAVTESATTAGNVTTEAAKPSTTDDVSVKIKEVEAEPVILSSGV
ncbi:cell wall integrity and stress response component 3 [Culex quinquefasciatus]|uniref:cell wall integrity and stress response component 3 n=1 Tax=Culex quinquefasciatus TaxID=7176 RepID=UPI0018E29A98|nr:cell wall integrity and stress response component 3 [Culex quinquefasciatus]